MNKQGDLITIIYMVIFLFILAIVLLFVNKLNQEIYGEMEINLNDTYANTESMRVLSDIKTTDQNIWDYAFFGIFMGCLIAIGLSAWAVRISPIFYWIYGILGLFVLGLGVILSNIWQEFAAEPDFAAEIANFPIMNTLLGTYYPLVVTAIIIITMIVLFGKPPGNEV